MTKALSAHDMIITEQHRHILQLALDAYVDVSTPHVYRWIVMNTTPLVPETNTLAYAISLVFPAIPMLSGIYQAQLAAAQRAASEALTHIMGANAPITGFTYTASQGIEVSPKSEQERDKARAELQTLLPNTPS